MHGADEAAAAPNSPSTTSSVSSAMGGHSPDHGVTVLDGATFETVASDGGGDDGERAGGGASGSDGVGDSIVVVGQANDGGDDSDADYVDTRNEDDEDEEGSGGDADGADGGDWVVVDEATADSTQPGHESSDGGSEADEVVVGEDVETEGGDVQEEEEEEEEEEEDLAPEVVEQRLADATEAKLRGNALFKNEGVTLTRDRTHVLHW